MLMKINIVVFGGNSILARNFINKYKSSNNIITISRKNENMGFLTCNLGEIIFNKQVDEIASNIIRKLIYKETVFILFAFYGGPRYKKEKDIYDKNINIIYNFLNITKKVNPKRMIFLSSALPILFKVFSWCANGTVKQASSQDFAASSFNMPEEVGKFSPFADS